MDWLFYWLNVLCVFILNHLDSEHVVPIDMTTDMIVILKVNISCQIELGLFCSKKQLAKCCLNPMLLTHVISPEH